MFSAGTMLKVTGAVLVGLWSAWPTQAQVYRCGNAYSHKPCAGGHEVDVSPPVSNLEGPLKKQVFLCRTTTGKLFWIHENCTRRGWSLERSEWVPSHLSWDEQIEHARSKKEYAESISAPPAVNYQQRAAPSEDMSSKAQQCQALNERVDWLDSLGRAGSTMYSLDWIREERRRARDKQFRIGC